MWQSIKDVKHRLDAQWQQLEHRERRLVGLMLMVVLLAFFYWALWLPLKAERENALDRLSYERELYYWLSGEVASIDRQRPSSAPNQVTLTSQTDLLTLLQKAVDQQGLSESLDQQIPLTEKTGLKKGVRLRFSSVSSQALYQLMANLESRNLSPAQLVITKGNEPGQVNVTLDYRL
ncbi:type II secretion system protein GspM [Thiomicrospira sp. WB1]|uniref:type II secretion system protein GspM n=1 Tax=Thiomicrospira sp. WB1 TaxID=1685380 RepID=UPI0007492AE0|nr:type II secretion system protein GspM [Thiomicrospira sp. WB1]KUJ72435.1 hypothetical protein AVO41_01060 [Thiomicrospira sp. WB1]